jgi:hypothetical protein
LVDDQVIHLDSGEYEDFYVFSANINRG